MAAPAGAPVAAHVGTIVAAHKGAPVAAHVGAPVAAHVGGPVAAHIFFCFVLSNTLLKIVSIMRGWPHENMAPRPGNELSTGKHTLVKPYSNCVRWLHI